MKEVYTAAVIKLIESGSDVETVLSNLTAVLTKRGHLSIHAAVVKNVLKQLSEGTDTDSATIITASAAGYEKHKAAIDAAVQTLGITATETVVNSNVIGGYIVKGNNKRVDASYKTKLIALYRKLT